jgi:DNA-binding transcriptional ArsR family regulator
MSVAEPHAAPADVFAALGDPTRLALLAALSSGSRRSLTSLAGDSKVTRQAVAKHLHVLESVGLVNRARVGRESRFALQPAPLDDARAYLATISAHWDDALARLKQFVEE